MTLIAFLVLFPLVASVILPFMKKHSKIRTSFIFLSCALIVSGVVYFVTQGLVSGKDAAYLTETVLIDRIMLAAEIAIAGLLIYFAFRYKRYYIALLSVLQTGMVVWLELFGGIHSESPHILSDKLTLMMCLIIGVVGCLICVFAVGYMKDYHHHHKEYKNRSGIFFALLFLFIGAMFGLVFSNNLLWMYFFWEITSVCSFLLIGYNKSKEAIKNSFRALWMNLLGGLLFAGAIVYSALVLDITDLASLVKAGTGTEVAIIPVIFLAFAGLTKSAQLPFSNWLLGAMVAPTPTSALLHSATMVKAGVYLLIRLAPTFTGNMVGTMVSTIGGFTFFAASLLAISQSDGKKVLAYSTISNLGLITACAGIGMHEAVWAGILLMMFHAVSKSLMFLSVGAVENSTGSRNIEDMHGLIIKLPKLAFVMITGIAGMFLAPFGMLISKWAALKAFVDSSSILLVVLLIFGSSSTLFYWTKWLAKLVAVLHNSERLSNKTGKGEWFSLVVHAIIMIAICVSFPLASTYIVEPFLRGMFHDMIPAVISSGNMNIMIMMLCAIVIMPIALRVLTLGKNHKVVSSYMGGVNSGDDRHFTDSFGQNKPMYLANWYMEDIFGEKKILRPSIVIAAAILTVLMVIVIGGSL